MKSSAENLGNRYESAWRACGRFAEWSDAMEVETTAFLRGLANETEDGDRQLKQHLHTYGVEFHPQVDPFWIRWRELDELGIIAPFLNSSERVFVGALPRLAVVDELIGQVVFRATPNILTRQVAPGSFLVTGTTQLLKMVYDLSVVFSSTTSAGFNIGPLDLYDSVSQILKNRYWCETMPPTWTHGYVPSQIEADFEWKFGTAIASKAITTFLLLHEAAHIKLGHCGLELDSALLPDERFVHSTEGLEDELAADQVAAGSTMVAMDQEARRLFGKNPEALQMVGRLSLAAVLKFVGTTEIARRVGVGRRSPGSADGGELDHDYPRMVGVAVGVSSAMEEHVASVVQQVGALRGFLDGVERRLVEAVG